MPSKPKQPPVIELRGLIKRYGMGDAEHHALNGVDLTIEKGEFITIMGPSGCGKTTLLNILGLLDHSTEGEYLLEGKSVEKFSGARHARIRSQQIGIIFQSFNLIHRLNVIENVALPLAYKGVHRKLGTVIKRTWAYYGDIATKRIYLIGYYLGDAACE